MPVENPQPTPPQPEDTKRATFFKLMEQAELTAFWSSMDGIVFTGHAPTIARATIEAIEAGLSKKAILTAARMGEQFGMPDIPPKPPPENPWHNPAYREAVQEEIDVFWEERYRDKGEE